MKKIDILKKKLIILGLISALGSPVYQNNISKAEEIDNTTIETTKEDINEVIEEDINIPELVTYYSNVYGIDEGAIYDLIDSKVNESKEEFVLDELAILNITNELYNSGSSNIRKEAVSSMTLAPELMVEKYANLIGVNKEVAMSIVYTECGYSVNSSNYLNNNNPAGIGPNMHFLNKEVGIIYFINMLKYSYGCNENSEFGFFPAVASTYCEAPEHWISLCSGNYSSIVDNYYSHRPDLIKDDKTLELEIK